MYITISEEILELSDAEIAQVIRHKFKRNHEMPRTVEEAVDQYPNFPQTFDGKTLRQFLRKFEGRPRDIQIKILRATINSKKSYNDYINKLEELGYKEKPSKTAFSTMKKLKRLHILE